MELLQGLVLGSVPPLSTGQEEAHFWNFRRSCGQKNFNGLGFKSFRLRVCKYFVAYRVYAFVAAAAACYVCIAIRTGTLQ